MIFKHFTKCYTISSCHPLLGFLCCDILTSAILFNHFTLLLYFTHFNMYMYHVVSRLLPVLCYLVIHNIYPVLYSVKHFSLFYVNYTNYQVLLLFHLLFLCYVNYTFYQVLCYLISYSCAMLITHFTQCFVISFHFLVP